MSCRHPPAPLFAQPQLDQMLAPVALYPDPLLGQVLMAATYPLEVVEAARWLQNPANAALRGDELAATLAPQPWAPSVKALVAVPQILTMMNKNLPWTEQLGNAFLAQQADVMNAVQNLRQRAEAVGALTSTPQQVVSTQGQVIVIEPENPDVVYIPMYNPAVVYGAWPYPAYRPYYFYPPGYDWGAGVIGFGVGIAVAHSIWGWDHWDWNHHRIDIDDGRYAALNRGAPPPAPGVWQHEPDHRHGVPYPSPALRAHFQGNAAPAAQPGFRGYAAPAATAPTSFHPAAYHPGNINRPQANHAQKPQPAPQIRAVAPPAAHRTEQAPRPRFSSPPAQAHIAAHPHVAAPASARRAATPIFESYAHGPDVRAQAARGAASRASVTPAPRRSPPPAHSGDNAHTHPHDNDRR